MQLMMCTPTYGHYLTVAQLSRFLDVPAADLQAVLLPFGTERCDHEMFLKVFGICRGRHGRDTCWHLLGCGHLFMLQQADCMHLLSANPQPTFW